MKRVAVLLNNGIWVDGRVQKILRTLSKKMEVHLFYVNPTSQDNELFDEKVVLHGIDHPTTFRVKLLRHTNFHKEFDVLAMEAKQSGLQFDYIYSNDLPTLRAGVALKKHFSASLIYDSHEIYVETFNQFFPAKGSWKSPLYQVNIRLLRSIGSKVERDLIKHVDHMITVNPKLADYFESRYGLEHVNVVYNAPLLSESQKRFDLNVDYRKDYGWDENDIILFYHGMMNRGRGLFRLMRCLTLLPDKFKLVLIGHGPSRKNLENLVETRALSDRVKFRDFVPNKYVIEYVAGADIGVTVLQTLNLSTNYSTPNKLFEYMHAGLHILSTDIPECTRIIKEFDLGIICAHDEKSIATCIQKMGQERDIHTPPRRVDEARRKYCWENQVNVFEKLFDTTLKE